MIFVIPGYLVASMCLDPKIEQMRQYLSGGYSVRRGNISLPPAFFSLGFMNLFVCICSKNEHC